MRTQVVSNFFCFTNNTATNDPVQMSFFTCTSSMLVLDMLAFFIYLLSQFPEPWSFCPARCQTHAHGGHFHHLWCGLYVPWTKLSPQIIEQSLQDVDFFTPLGKSKVSAAWQWLFIKAFGLGVSRFLDAINSSLNLCETQALACDFGRTFHTDSKQRQTRFSCSLAEPVDRLLSDLYFPLRGGPPSMPAISRGFILFIQ